jgi:hypothetical protein
VQEVYLGHGRDMLVASAVHAPPDSAEEPIVCVAGIHTFYGKSDILHDRLARAPGGRGGRAPRPQRRRQVHHAQEHDGAGAAGARARRVRRPRYHRQLASTVGRISYEGPAAPLRADLDLRRQKLWV